MVPTEPMAIGEDREIVSDATYVSVQIVQKNECGNYCVEQKRAPAQLTM